MHWRRAGLVIAPALLAACSPPSDDAMAVAEAAETPAADDSAIPLNPYPPSDPVPEKLLGDWIYSHDECELDSEFSPNTRKIEASISFEPDGIYYMDVEGFAFTGTYRFDSYEGGKDQRFQLHGNLLNFNVAGDTLQNWSEGDAVYQCGRVFVRKGG
jgi:hypothetical protein